MDPTQKDRPPIEAKLGLWDAVSIIVGIIIGAGIYETPPDIFSKLPDALTALAIWGGCGLLAPIIAPRFSKICT